MDCLDLLCFVGEFQIFTKNFISLYFIYFIFGCAWSSLLHRLSLVAMKEGYSLVAVHGLLTAGASLVGEHGLGSFGMWDLPRSGSHPSPALAGRLFTPKPPGKPSLLCEQLLSLLEPP